MANTAIIIGASGAVGSELARTLHGRGWHLHLIGRREEALAPLAEEVGARTAVADVTDAQRLAEAVGAAAADGVAGVAYCVGRMQALPFEEAEPEAYLESYRLHVVGAAVSLRAALPALRQARGSAVLFSNGGATFGYPHHSVVGAAKAGTEGLALSLAAELAPAVRVNCIVPGVTQAAGTAEPTGPGPLRRVSSPEDVAGLAAILLSGESSWITGQVIRLDQGGRGSITRW